MSWGILLDIIVQVFDTAFKGTEERNFIKEEDIMSLLKKKKKYGKSIVAKTKKQTAHCNSSV